MSSVMILFIKLVFQLYFDVFIFEKCDFLVSENRQDAGCLLSQRSGLIHHQTNVKTHI